MGNWTPSPWSLGEINEHLGYDCMTAGIRIGPAYLDGAQYGQKACRDLPDDGRERMLADARLISAAPDMYAVLRELAECSEYWSEYDVPLGIHDRIATALAKASSQ